LLLFAPFKVQKSEGLGEFFLILIISFSCELKLLSCLPLFSPGNRYDHFHSLQYCSLRRIYSRIRMQTFSPLFLDILCLRNWPMILGTHECLIVLHVIRYYHSNCKIFCMVDQFKIVSLVRLFSSLCQDI